MVKPLRTKKHSKIWEEAQREEAELCLEDMSRAKAMMDLISICFINLIYIMFNLINICLGMYNVTLFSSG